MARSTDNGNTRPLRGRGSDKTYTEVVTVALSPGQKEKLDARVTASMNRSDILRAALDAYLDGAVSGGSPGISDEDVARIADAVAEKVAPPRASTRRTTAVRAKLPAPSRIRDEPDPGDVRTGLDGVPIV